MAIFNKSDTTHTNTKSNGGNDTTIITAGSKIKGEMNVTCKIFIDGEFDGSIISTKEVNIGQKGLVKGEITTDRIIVQGTVEGDINANRVELKSTGRVKGTIESIELLIESKAIFEGSSILKKEKKELKGSLSTSEEKSKTDTKSK